jgi:poly(glycerol-phosphate) alpha-glucosyltransferase
MHLPKIDISLGIVVPSTSRAGGGIYSSARDLAQTVHDLGTPVEVYGYSDKWSAADRPEWGSLLPKTYPRLAPKSVGWSPALKKALLRSEVQIIHQHGLWTLSSSYVTRWALHSSKPVIVSPHGMLDPWALANAAWKKRIAVAAYQKRSLARASCIHALNTAEV